MSIEIEAVFENGVFRPTSSVPGLDERDRVILTVRKRPNLKKLRSVCGSLSPEEAEEMMRLIREGRRVEGDW